MQLLQHAHKQSRSCQLVASKEFGNPPPISNGTKASVACAIYKELVPIGSTNHHKPTWQFGWQGCIGVTHFINPASHKVLEVLNVPEC